MGWLILRKYYKSLRLGLGTWGNSILNFHYGFSELWILSSKEFQIPPIFMSEENFTWLLPALYTYAINLGLITANLLLQLIKKCRSKMASSKIFNSPTLVFSFTKIFGNYRHILMIYKIYLKAKNKIQPPANKIPNLFL